MADRRSWLEAVWDLRGIGLGRTERSVTSRSTVTSRAASGPPGLSRLSAGRTGRGSGRRAGPLGWPRPRPADVPRLRGADLAFGTSVAQGRPPWGQPLASLTLPPFAHNRLR